MLAGEPGIGKTRAAQELALYAASDDAQVRLGWCHQQQGSPPFWSWIQPIRSYIQQTDAESLNVQMDAGARDISEIIPEVREKLPNIESVPLPDLQQARFRLFDSTTMRNANTNIQLNIGNSGALVIKNTAKLLGGMVAMSTLYGSISTDSPSKPLPSWLTDPTRWISNT